MVLCGGGGGRCGLSDSVAGIVVKMSEHFSGGGCCRTHVHDQNAVHRGGQRDSASYVGKCLGSRRYCTILMTAGFTCSMRHSSATGHPDLRGAYAPDEVEKYAFSRIEHP